MILLQTFFALLFLQLTIASDSTGQCPFGYELIEFRLEYLENKVSQLFEKLETIVGENQLATDERMENLSANVTRILELLEGVERTGALVDHQNRLDKIDDAGAVVNNASTITTCRDAPSTGIFQLKLPTLSPTAPAPIPVLCGVTLSHGTWLVIQQRFDGSVDFNRNWTEYRNGFGAMASFGEFWLGLEPISQITRSGGEFELMVELKNEAGEYGWARYDRFEVDEEGGKYQLAELGDYGGTMGDCMGNSGGMKFTTVDSDNDNWSRNCAQHYLGGWWYNSCVFNNLNGLFQPKPGGYGIHWNGWTKAATYSRMMIRRK
ncbi:fibrinogen-like protein A [Culex pipiens pallens]|uniref:fibrinogen-like protein A n=1 Tax=Culex pipiens pallens TaxID=42434 RepID=UPI001954BAE3|nr:fibrinogen-like protein A [Culex pipiens pallens]